MDCLFTFSVVSLEAQKFKNLLMSNFFFWPLRAACGILVPRAGIEPEPPAWELGVLTTGPPGKSLDDVQFMCFFLLLLVLLISCLETIA